MLRFFVILCVPFSAFLFAAVASSADDKRGIAYFEKYIRPVLSEHCYKCHSGKSKELGGGLYVDTRRGIRAGGENGKAVVPKKPKDSLLISAMEYDEFEMPPDGQLDEDVIDRFREWIKMGAPDPRDGKAPKKKPTKESVSLWSTQPIIQLPLP